MTWMDLLLEAGGVLRSSTAAHLLYVLLGPHAFAGGQKQQDAAQGRCHHQA